VPGFDGTGPMGMGSMTGGGRGLCAIPLRSAWPAYAGRGFHIPYTAPWGVTYHGDFPFAPQITREKELDYLKGLVKSLRDNLEEIEVKIQQIESKKE
jgi:hypothetical protein